MTVSQQLRVLPKKGAVRYSRSLRSLSVKSPCETMVGMVVCIPATFFSGSDSSASLASLPGRGITAASFRSLQIPPERSRVGGG